MAQNLIIPKLGNTVESVVIAEWRKEIGELVAVGDVLCEVETDKTTVEVEAEESGTLLALLFEEGDEVPVLAPFAVLGEPGEKISLPVSSGKQLAPDEKAASTLGESGGSVGGTGLEVSPKKKDGKKISPRARRLAELEGLDDLPERGSGPGGRIIEQDVLITLERTTEAGSVPTVSENALSPANEAGEAVRVPLRGARRVIAERMRASLRDTAQLTLNTSATAASLLAWRASLKNSLEKTVGPYVADISINDLIMFAVSRTLPRHPALNALLIDGEIRQYVHVHLGFAVDTPRGLMVPVLRFADTLSLRELSGQTRHLAVACRDGSIGTEELSGGTFTVTNLGPFGIESFTPVLNAPQTAILGVGAIVNAPIEKADGGLGLEKRLNLSLTIDHQAVDGAPGARFLQELTEMLAHFEWLLAL